MLKTSAHHSVIGVILAGGLSSRMGKNKAFLDRNGQNMLQFTRQHLEQAGVDQVVISGPGSLSQENLDAVEDEHSQLGPLAGIYSVLSKMPDQVSCLFVPVDLPFLSAKALRPMIAAARKHETSIVMQGQPLPLMIVNSPEIRLILSNIITQQERLSIKHFLSLIQVIEIPEAHLDAWFNANTPEDWAHAQQTWSQEKN